ncbi:MAG TPA: 4-hydroxyphenylpyruvate dioxygenase [Jatrophihabitans sp.]|jgi:4-hydroxymandelate synthase|uniref:4-hydroxyphenylpyruvate dioxygenase n=1 Tax=Jatrophihabitans sp. TaxID=1932789 RepID=UPI002EDCF8C5
MNISGIDHIELYVGDAQQSAYYFGSAFGLEVGGQGGPETGLTGQRSLLMVQGEVRMLLTSGLYADHSATEYVHRHGDGVAVVAMRVEDAAASFEALVRRGAEPISPPKTYSDDTSSVIVAEVAGFGDVIHRLVQRNGEGFLPGAIEMTEREPAEDPMFNKIDHLAICVPARQLQATSEFYQQVYGFAEIFTEYIEVAGQGMNSVVVQSPSGEVTFTLIEPDTQRRAGQIDDFLQWHAGAGVQHVALITDDIVSTVDRLGGRGVRFLTTPAAYYRSLEDRVGAVDAPIGELSRLGILVDRDHWGQLLQIFTESTHVRRTLFIEVIERRGARTFGSGNIKALYEAKEREMVHAPTPMAADPDPEPMEV